MPPDPPRDRPPVPGAGEIYLEVIRQGNAVKAIAIDSHSGREASATGPAAARGEVERIAIAKLYRLLRGTHLREADEAESETPPIPGRGIVV